MLFGALLMGSSLGLKLLFRTSPRIVIPVSNEGCQFVVQLSSDALHWNWLRVTRAHLPGNFGQFSRDTFNRAHNATRANFICDAVHNGERTGSLVVLGHFPERADPLVNEFMIGNVLVGSIGHRFTSPLLPS